MYKKNSLTPTVLSIVCDKGTEAPFSGIYHSYDKKGSYLCRLCGYALFRSTDKFISSCGWPGFDDEIDGRIKRQADSDGKREEIICARCCSHLGHVFLGEGLTDKNLRHCVNALALDFVPCETVLDTNEVIVAGGCFWGIQALMDNEEGVLLTEVGYTGGKKVSPSYELVCRGDTGHFEAVRVVFDVDKTDVKKLLKAFFESHTPTQKNGQGPDVGSQYKSAFFYYDDKQKKICEQLIAQLTAKEGEIATEVLPLATFWPAEPSHQHYLKKHPERGCHCKTKRF